MQITKRQCDQSVCNNDAEHFTFFKERRMDGAGSSENWYYGFDLCQTGVESLLQKLLDTFGQSHETTILKILKDLNIKWREE